MLIRKLTGFIRLFRPELPFAAGVCVVIGEIVALGAFPSVRQAALGFACGFFISGSALVSNDYFDLDVDQVNAPERPLPSGMVTPAEALIWADIDLERRYYGGPNKAARSAEVFWEQLRDAVNHGG